MEPFGSLGIRRGIPWASKVSGDAAILPDDNRAFSQLHTAFVVDFYGRAEYSGMRLFAVIELQLRIGL